MVVDFLLVLLGVVLDVFQDRVPDRVHVAEEPRDVLVVDEGLGQELCAVVRDHVMAQVERPDLQVLLEELDERLD